VLVRDLKVYLSPTSRPPLGSLFPNTPLFSEPGPAMSYSLGGDGACSLSFLALMGVCVDSYGDLNVTAIKGRMLIPPCRVGASTSSSYYTSVFSLSFACRRLDEVVCALEVLSSRY
jgi:hypothetical protein